MAKRVVKKGKKPAKKSAKKSKTASKTAKKSTKKTAKKSPKKSAKKSARKQPKKRATKKAAKRTKPTKRATKAPKRTAKQARSTARLEDGVTLRIYDVHDVPDDKHFFFVNGHRVKNVKELAEVMDRIEHEVFDYHVNEHRNDFYSWVAHVFEDLELAEKLLGVTGPKHLQFTIYKHVADKALKKK